MSSQVAEELGPNAVICYFPWFPYYLRYQVGFATLVNPPETQEDPSVAGQSQRFIHVQLYFPDGFPCNPANFDEILHHISFEDGAIHVLLPHPHFHPPMYPDYPHAALLFYHHVPLDFQRAVMWQEQPDARLVVYNASNQPGEFMIIDGTLYDVIPQCNEYSEFHSEPEHIHNQRPQGVPKRKRSKQSHKQSGRSHQRPSNSEITIQPGTSYGAQRPASESVATDPKNHLQNQDKPTITQQTAEEHQHGSHESVQGIQHKNDNVATLSTQANVATSTEEIDRLDMDGLTTDENIILDDDYVLFDSYIFMILIFVLCLFELLS
ncbi:uncharacterized protein LOC126184919 [Schistocerca cancellata]|uniref:uncharacterized protein LOC126184919 n=1 Tax=Schistocerca cancellata TaxID=274614 RepID=UPI002119A389|nr:uncharacterized protein LOC126184919 [Schistocerca cancellata]